MDDDDRDNLIALLDRIDVVGAGHCHDAGLAAELSRLCDDVRRERDRLRRQFADARSWEANPRSTYSLHKLATGRRPRTAHDPLVDHDADVPVCDVLDRFREVRTGPNGKVGQWPVGIVTHTRADRAAIEAFADRAGLHVEHLPWSWLDPRCYNAALFTHPDPERRPAGGPNPRASGAPHRRSATRQSRGCTDVASETPDDRAHVRRATSAPAAPSRGRVRESLSTTPEAGDG